MANYIYIGPNVLTLGLQENQLALENEPNIFLKKLIEKERWLGSMFIPTSELALARKRAKQQGTVEYKAYQYLKQLSREQITNLLES